jgi:hypothetical protein
LVFFYVGGIIEGKYPCKRSSKHELERWHIRLCDLFCSFKTTNVYRFDAIIYKSSVRRFLSGGSRNSEDDEPSVFKVLEDDDEHSVILIIV